MKCKYCGTKANNATIVKGLYVCCCYMLHFQKGEYTQYYIERTPNVLIAQPRKECGGSTADSIKEDIEKMPTADVVEVKHGEWIYSKTHYEADECNCSLCGQLMTTACNVRMNYCPNCGARMDGKPQKDGREI